MVNLSPEQKATVASLKAAKQLFGETEAALDAQYADALEAAKSNIRGQVRRAREQGIPQRQIHLSLGYQQIAQLENFLKDKRLTVKQTTLLDRILEAPIPEAVATPLVGIDDSVPRWVQVAESPTEDGMSNFHEELHLNGKVYPFMGVVMGGDVLYIQGVAGSNPGEFPEEVRALLVERYEDVLTIGDE